MKVYKVYGFQFLVVKINSESGVETENCDSSFNSS